MPAAINVLHPPSDPLAKSFIRTVPVFFVIQLTVFFAYALPFGFTARYIIPFVITASIFHVAILVLLFAFRHDFITEPDGRRLTYINRANRITLFRLCMLPAILFIIIANKDFPIRLPLIILVGMVFATDFLDGWVSRKDGETTRIGKMMDSASDYSLLIVITIVFYYFRIIPVWFLIALLTRLSGQGLMMLAVLAIRKRVTVQTSFMGKATVACTMVLYTFELLRFVTDIHPIIYRIAEYSVGLVIIVSIVDKVLLMLADLRKPAELERGAGRLSTPPEGEHYGRNKKRP